MLLPTIPPIVPNWEQDDPITLDKTIQLLLKSIAMEEISLAKLMDAERTKVLQVFAHCRCGEGTLHDAVEVNKSVNDMMQTIAQLQMLLQFKLKNVQELSPVCRPKPLPCPGPVARKTCYGCCMMGTGKGCIENSKDRFYGRPVSIYAFIPCKDRKNDTIRYIVGNNCDGLYLFACDQNIKVQCPEGCANQIMICGEGRLKTYCDEVAEEIRTGAFTLTVSEKLSGQVTFRMIITGETEDSLEHDSGWVSIENACSDLHMKVCHSAV